MMTLRTNRMIRMFALIAAANATYALGQTTDDRLCADQNADGMVTPADFTAWISNYNSNNPIADVNQDGSVTPADFTAWISAFNMGENGPGCTVDLGDGGHVSGRISYVGDVDTFTVRADAGDDLLFSITETPVSGLDLRVDLYGPSGQLIGTDFATTSTGFRFDKYDVPASGTYTYVIRDYYNTDTGNYTFTVVVADDELDLGFVALSSGETQTDSLERGDIDTFTINATAGDDLLFTIHESPVSGHDLIVTLHGPDGQLIDTDFATTSSGFRFDNYNVPASGRYTYVIRDYYGTDSGDYTLTAVVADGNVNADNVALSSGQTVSGSLAIADIDTFTINATAGDDLLFTIHESPVSGHDLIVTLHGPDGQLIDTDFATTSSGFRFDNYNVPASGRYTYVIRDYYGTDSGGYTLTATVTN